MTTYKIVPTIPTDSMLNAALRLVHEGYVPNMQGLEEYYCAMIDNVPIHSLTDEYILKVYRETLKNEFGNNDNTSYESVFVKAVRTIVAKIQHDKNT